MSGCCVLLLSEKPRDDGWLGWKLWRGVIFSSTFKLWLPGSSVILSGRHRSAARSLTRGPDTTGKFEDLKEKKNVYVDRTRIYRFLLYHGRFPVDRRQTASDARVVEVPTSRVVPNGRAPAR
jgi:hypothetical protein